MGKKIPGIAGQEEKMGIAKEEATPG
jgi:hypothetical protein